MSIAGNAWLRVWVMEDLPLSEMVRRVLPQTDRLDATRRTGADTAPDLLVVDLVDLEPGRCQELRNLRKRYPNVPLLARLWNFDPQLVLEAARLGVQGFLGPNASLPEVEQALECLWRGETYLPPEAVSPLLEGLRAGQG